MRRGILIEQQQQSNRNTYDFCEAQDGKGGCDRTAATIKSGTHMISARHKMRRGILIEQQQQSNQENI